GSLPAIDAQDLDSYYPPPPPEVVPEGWEFDEYLARAQDRIVPLHEDVESQAAFAPTPPNVVDQDAEQSKFVGWSTWALEDDHTFTTPTPPQVIPDDTDSSKWVATSAIQHDDTDTQRVDAPTPPPIVPVDESDSKIDVTVRSRQHDDTETQPVPIVPTTFQEEPIERWSAGPPAIDAEDKDSYYPPPPPPVVPEGWEFEDYLPHAQDRVVPIYEDAETQRVLPPTPPTTDQVDELQQKNVDWSVKQQDDTETQRGSAPTPPLSIEQDTEQAKVIGWNAPAVEDDATALPPTPPSAIEQDTEQAKYVDWSKPAIEDDTRVLPPTPPSAIQDEISERFRDDRQVFHDDTESQRDLPPTPPLTQAEDDVQLRADWKAPALEDDHSFTAPTPPVVGPNDADSLLWSATASIQPDDL